MVASPLIIVQGDSYYQRVRRRGRFSVERACADSDAHLEAAVKNAQERMISGLARLGYEYIDDGFVLEGPLAHVETSLSVEADPGPNAQPATTDPEQLAAWERAEKARNAQKFDVEGLDRVDFELVATFRRKYPGAKRILGSPANLRAN